MEVVAGDYNERSLFNGHGNLGRSRNPISLPVGPVKQGHAVQIHLAGLHHKRKQVFHGIAVIAHCKKPFVEKGSDRRILIAKDAGVEGIGGHALHAKEQKGF